MKILLAIDGSGYSDAAVETVANRLWPAGSQIRVMTVIEPLPRLDAMLVPKAAVAEQMLQQDLQTMLSDAVGKLKAKLVDVQVDLALITGDPKQSILKTAQEYNADFIVIGAHGTDSGFSDTRLGSVAQAVLAHSSCSVLLVDDDDLEALAKKADRKMSLAESKYLVAVDQSEHSKAVVDSILSRQWPDGCEFSFLHVVGPVHEHHGGFSRLSAKSEVSDLSSQVVKSETAAGEALVKSIAAKFEQQLPNVKVTCHVLVGNIRSTILQIAQDWPADVVFIGSHGIKGVLEFLLGSVTTAVANNTECSVEVIKIKS